MSGWEEEEEDEGMDGWEEAFSGTLRGRVSEPGGRGRRAAGVGVYIIFAKLGR